MPGYADPTNTAIDKGASIAGQCSEKQNFAGTHVSDWHKSDTTGTCFVLTDDQPKENAAADAPRNDAKDIGKRDVSPDYDIAELTARHPIIAMHWGFGA